MILRKKKRKRSPNKLFENEVMSMDVNLDFDYEAGIEVTLRKSDEQVRNMLGRLGRLENHNSFDDRESKMFFQKVFLHYSKERDSFFLYHEISTDNSIYLNASVISDSIHDMYKITRMLLEWGYINVVDWNRDIDEGIYEESKNWFITVQRECVDISDKKYFAKEFNAMPKQEVDYMINQLMEIELIQPFQVVKSTLKRMGVLERNCLYQTAHILYKKGKYYLVHFKQLFELDGKTSDISEEDLDRLHKIAYRLGEWGIITIKDPDHKKRADACSDVSVHVIKMELIKNGDIILKKRYNL